MMLRISKQNSGNRTVFPLFTQCGDWVAEYDLESLGTLQAIDNCDQLVVNRAEAWGVTVSPSSIVPFQLWWDPDNQVLDNYCRKPIQINPLRICKFFSDGTEDITQTAVDRYEPPAVLSNATCKQVAVTITDLLRQELQHIATNNDDVVLFRTGGLDCAVLESIVENYLIDIKIDDSFYGDPYPAVTHYDNVGPQQQFLMKYDSAYMKIPPSTSCVLTGFFAEQTALCWPGYMRSMCYTHGIDFMQLHVDAVKTDAYYAGYIESHGLLNAKKFPFFKSNNYYDTCQQIDQEIMHTQPVFGVDGKVFYSPFNNRNIAWHMMSLEKQELAKHFHNKEVWWEIIELNNPSTSKTVISPKLVL